MTDSAVKRPAGTPVGRALDIPAGIAYDDLREVVAAIDRVHGDGELPRIPVRLVAGMISRGRFRFDLRSGPLSVTLRANYAHAGLALVHEIGHFLDMMMFGDGRAFGSCRNALLGSWRIAVEGSNLFRLLDSVVRDGVASVQESDGSPRMVTPDDDELLGVKRALQIEELWACSYAQFVAIRSGDASLRAGLDRLRVRLPGKVYYPRQWDDDDFRPIAVTIDGVMSQLGWRE